MNHFFKYIDLIAKHNVHDVSSARLEKSPGGALRTALASPITGSESFYNWQVLNLFLSGGGVPRQKWQRSSAASSAGAMSSYNLHEAIEMLAPCSRP